MADKASITRAAEAACVEDFNEDSETAVPETKKTANITAKRSKPDVTRLHVLRDEFSDSGHSSQTLATLGSTNTSLESKSGPLTIRPESHAVAAKTRPTKIDEEPRSKSQSPEKLPLQRTASKRRKEEIPRREQCSCSKCVTKERRATPYNPSKSTGKARAEISQQTRAPPVHVVKETPVPYYPPPRTRAHSYHRERPLSFHAGAAPEHLYIQTQQPLYNEPQPTLSYTPTAPIIPTSYPSHASPYIPPPQPLHQPQPQQFYTPPPSPYEYQPRPRPRQWTSDYQVPSRPQSMLYPTPPIIEYVAEPTYTPVSTSAQPPSRQSSYRERSRALPEQRSTRDEDYYKMPPPAPPPPRHKSTSHRNQRPAIRHSVTADAPTTNTQRRPVRDESITAHVGNESPVEQIYGTHERVRRPSRNTGDESAANIYGLERSMARTNLGSYAVKRGRRASVYGHESLNELADEVEAYQASHGNSRTSNQIPIPPTSSTRKKTHASSKSSETSSRKSAKSGKSRTSRTSRDGSDLKARRPSENDKFSMRFDASHGVNVDLKGGMEGRRISVRQNKDEGEMEFSIGSRGRSTTGAGRESRDKSRKRSSYRNGQSETEIARTRAMSHPRMKIREEEVEEDEREPRIIRERIMTRTRSRRGSSRVRGDRVGFL